TPAATRSNPSRRPTRTRSSTDDDLKRSEKEIQLHTDKFTADIEKHLKTKEADLKVEPPHPRPSLSQMNIHEYQARPCSKSSVWPVPKGVAVQTADQFAAALAQLDGTGGYMVKSQIHAGGRGKGTFTDGSRAA
ncbi:succinate--CoA ligase [ADP-forming] subunit beta, partial [Verrucomicrobiota bacterium]